KRAMGGAFETLGSIARQRGELLSARSLFKQSLAIWRELDDKPGIAVDLGNLGCLAYDLGDDAAARSLFDESLELSRQVRNRWGGTSRKWGDRVGPTEVLEALGNLPATMGRAQKAARILGAAESSRDAIARRLPPAEQADHDRAVAIARRALGEERFAAACAE